MNPEHNPISNEQNKKQKGNGRKNIQIAKIQNKTNREVTFSKQRFGIFKKASELSTLTGAKTAIIMFNPKGKVHSSGSPNLEGVVNRHFNNKVHGVIDPVFEEHMNNIKQININELTKMEGLVELEKKKSIELKKHMMMSRNQGLLPAELDQLVLQQLLEVQRKVENFYVMYGEETQCYFNAKNVQVLEATTTTVPLRPLQTNIPLNVVHSHSYVSTSARSFILQGRTSSTTSPVYNQSLTFGGQLTNAGPSGVNIGCSSSTDCGPSKVNFLGYNGTNFDETSDHLMFSDYFSTPFTGESFGIENSNYMVQFDGVGGSYGTNIYGLSYVSISNEFGYPSWYSGVAENMFPPPDGTFEGYDKQFSYTNARGMVAFNSGMNFGYHGEFRDRPSADEDFGVGPSTRGDFGAGSSNDGSSF